jgi:CheY-like chemotaxis protein
MGLDKVDTILLVDDDPITCYLNAKVLEEIGFKGSIAEVCSGEAALDYLRKTRAYDTHKKRVTLILLDINMPEMNGFEFLQELEVLEVINKEKLFVAILSSSSSPKDLDEAAKHRLSGYLQKPLSGEQVIALLDTLVLA